MRMKGSSSWDLKKMKTAGLCNQQWGIFCIVTATSLNLVAAQRCAPLLGYWLLLTSVPQRLTVGNTL